MTDYDPLFYEKLFSFIKYLDSFGLGNIIEIVTYLLAAFKKIQGKKEK